jgi:hypothetical protein
MNLALPLKNVTHTSLRTIMARPFVTGTELRRSDETVVRL